MGEFAEAMLDGTFCVDCGEPLFSGAGFPDYCADCASEIVPMPSDRGPVPCTCECGKHFPSKKARARHRAKACPVHRVKVCPIDGCNRGVKTMHGLREHIRDKHGIPFEQQGDLLK